MKPPPPPIVSMRYLAPGARVLNPHLIPAELVISTNSIGVESFLAVCRGSSFANRPVKQIVKISQAIRMVFIGTLNLFANRWRKDLLSDSSLALTPFVYRENPMSSTTLVKAKNLGSTKIIDSCSCLRSQTIVVQEFGWSPVSPMGQLRFSSPKAVLDRE